MEERKKKPVRIDDDMKWSRRSCHFFFCSSNKMSSPSSTEKMRSTWRSIAAKRGSRPPTMSLVITVYKSPIDRRRTVRVMGRAARSLRTGEMGDNPAIKCLDTVIHQELLYIEKGLKERNEEKSKKKGRAGIEREPCYENEGWLKHQEPKNEPRLLLAIPLHRSGWIDIFSIFQRCRLDSKDI